MATTLIVVRHGQTAWNKDERFRGRTDLPLNETGLRQAEAAARRIADDYRPAALYCGPLRRTVQTAEAIGRATGLPLQTDDGLLDLDYGDFAGLSRPEAKAKFPALYHTWVTTPGQVRFPHGETLADVQARSTDLVLRVARRYPAAEVVLATHLVVCRVLLVSLLGLGLDQIDAFEVSPASLTIFALERGRAVLVKSNETCHLRDLAG